MSQHNSSSSGEENDVLSDSSPDSASIIHPTPVTGIEPKSSSRGRTPARSDSRSPRRRGHSSPPPARPPSFSPASSYRSAVPTIPPIGKWTVAGLREALGKSDIQAPRKLNKAELYDLYVSLQLPNLSPKHTPAPKASQRRSGARKARTPPLSSRTRSGSLRLASRSNRPSASLGRAPDSAGAGPLPLPYAAQLRTAASAAAAPYAAGPTGLPTASISNPPAVNNTLPFQWPPAPVADANLRQNQLAAQAQTFQQFYPTSDNPAHIQWPAHPVARSSSGASKRECAPVRIACVHSTP